MRQLHGLIFHCAIIQRQHRLRAGGQAKFIATACKKIADKLRGKAGRRRAQQPSPGDQNHSWAKKLLANPHITPFPDLLPPWSESPGEVYFQAKATATATQSANLHLLKTYHKNAWTQSWKRYQSRTITPSVAQAAPPGKAA